MLACAHRAHTLTDGSVLWPKPRAMPNQQDNAQDAMAHILPHMHELHDLNLINTVILFVFIYSCNPEAPKMHIKQAQQKIWSCILCTSKGLVEVYLLCVTYQAITTWFYSLLLILYLQKSKQFSKNKLQLLKYYYETTCKSTF